MVVRRIGLRALLALGLLMLTLAALWLLGARGLTLAGVEVVAIALMLVGDRSVGSVMDRRMRGCEGEMHVGALLDGMTERGWLTIHDAYTGRGNVDHIVIGPGGLLTVETKSHAGRVQVANVDPAWLRQAWAERKYVESISGHPVADCLLVFSRAYLDRAPARRRGVLMLPARMLVGHLQRRKPVLTPEQVQTLHRRIAQELDGENAAR
jgi:hypothetical protein